MRILHVLNSADPENGGTVQAVREMSAHQAALGYEVIVISTGRDDPPMSSQGETWKVFPVQWNAWKWSYAMQKAMPEIIREADIVHLHTVWEFPVYYGHAMSLRFDKPYVISPHGMLDRWSLEQHALKKRIYLWRMGQSIIAGAGAVHFTSRPEAERSRFMPMQDKAIVIPLGVTLSDFGNPDEKAFYHKFPKLSGNRFILFLGRLHTKKRPDLAIRAYQKISRDFKNHYFLMAGPGEVQDVLKLKKIVNDYGLQNRVLFSGMLDRSLALAAYRQADLFVLSSRQENFGLSVAEAMASGCPVVVSPQVNLSEEIEKANAGMVVLPNEEAMAQSIRRLLQNSNLREQMGQNGRQLVFERFAWNKIILEYIEIYKNIIANHGLIEKSKS